MPSPPAPTPLRTVRAVRYAAPLREGGSLPGLLETDDDGVYVTKFRGAGQGPMSLVAEVIAHGLGRAMGLPIPDVVLVDLDPRIAPAEPDPEIQDLLRASEGLNVGMDFLPGSLAFDTASVEEVDPELAARVVWFDAALTNIDRTPRNPNMIRWHGDLWLIDHGAALYQQHQPGPLAARADRAFAGVRDHVLLPAAGDLADAQGAARAALTPEVIAASVSAVPDGWLTGPDGDLDPAERRDDYAEFLQGRVHHRDVAADVESVRDAQQ